MTTNILPFGQVQFSEPAFSGQNWGSNRLVPASGVGWGRRGVTEALDCPRRREALVPLPKGRAMPGSAHVTHICSWMSPVCCEGGLRPLELEPSLSCQLKGNRDGHRNGQVWKFCPGQIPWAEITAAYLEEADRRVKFNIFILFFSLSLHFLLDHHMQDMQKLTVSLTDAARQLPTFIP